MEEETLVPSREMYVGAAVRFLLGGLVTYFVWALRVHNIYEVQEDYKMRKKMNMKFYFKKFHPPEYFPQVILQELVERDLVFTCEAIKYHVDIAWHNKSNYQ